VRVSKSLLVLLLLIPSARPAAAQHTRYDWKTWGAVSDTLRAEQGAVRLILSSAFVVEGSERVAIAVVIVRGGRDHYRKVAAEAPLAADRRYALYAFLLLESVIRCE
jgi:hypothetical protein